VLMIISNNTDVFYNGSQSFFSISFMYLFHFLSGDYEVSIKFNDEHIPDSPFIVPTASLSDDARLLTISSLQVSDSRSNTHAERPRYSL